MAQMQIFLEQAWISTRARTRTHNTIEAASWHLNHHSRQKKFFSDLKTEVKKMIFSRRRHYLQSDDDDNNDDVNVDDDGNVDDDNNDDYNNNDNNTTDDDNDGDDDKDHEDDDDDDNDNHGDDDDVVDDVSDGRPVPFHYLPRSHFSLLLRLFRATPSADIRPMTFSLSSNAMAFRKKTSATIIQNVSHE